MLLVWAGIHSGFGEEAKKKKARNLLNHEIIDIEESAAGQCKEGPQCVRGTFVCNMHRVAAVHAKEAGAKPSQLTCFIIGDVLHRRPG